MSISRRKFLGWVGAAGLSTTIGKSAAAATNKHFKGYPDSFGVLHDSELCVGCRNCEAACNKVNNLPPPDKPFNDLSVMCCFLATGLDIGGRNVLLLSLNLGIYIIYYYITAE